MQIKQPRQSNMKVKIWMRQTKGERESRKRSPPPSSPLLPVLWSSQLKESKNKSDFYCLFYFPLICFHLSAVCPANDGVRRSLHHPTEGRQKRRGKETRAEECEKFEGKERGNVNWLFNLKQWHEEAEVRIKNVNETRTMQVIHRKK